MDTKKEFNIIRFTADKRRYYPVSTRKQKWMGDNYVKHNKIEIPIGHSRYGGPVMDLPADFKHPKNMHFAGQLDLAKFSPFDTTGLLPKKGQLIFFGNLMTERGKVIYADIPNEKLVRLVVEHEQDFWDGVLIDEIFADTETFDERFMIPENDDDKEFANEDGKIWDWFAGSDKSKIFGIYTNCQYDEKKIKKMTLSENILLLQIGQNGFNDEGVLSVSIDKTDLLNKNFDKCKFSWGQS